MQNAEHSYSTIGPTTPWNDYPKYQDSAGQSNGANTAIPPTPFSRHARGSMSGVSNAPSPTLSDPHRMSSGTSAPFLQHMQPPSLDGSDAVSPSSATGEINLSEQKPVAPKSKMSSISQTSGTSNEKAKAKEKAKDKHREGTKVGENDGENVPAWAELKTKAGKDRKRLPLACIACRRKKIRCSGEKPACKHCLRSRIPCVYKVTTRKAAPRTDYMAMLDKRLKRMEERVIKIMPKDDQRNVDVIGRAVVKPANQVSLPKQDSKKRVAEEAFGEDLDRWAQSRSAQDEHRRVNGQDSLRDDLMTEGSQYLPVLEIQQHLAEVFFDFVYGQSYHLFHKPSYMRKLEAGQLPPVLVLSVCALAARFSTHPELRSEPAFLRGEKWAKPASDIALKRYDSPNITILICYLLLGLHEFGTCHGGRSWMFGGMAQRMAYALKMHQDLDVGSAGSKQNDRSDLSSTDREIRRRTMWACFMMDRFNSSGTDRPPFVSESYIRLQLPIKEHYFQMEIDGTTECIDGHVPRVVEPDSGQITDPKENMGVAAYTVRAVGIWGDVVRYINLGGREKDSHLMSSDQSGFAKLRTSIKDYRHSLPEFLVWNEDNLQAHATENIANQFIFLHIIINQISLFMNRFALPVSGSRPAFTKDMPSEFLSECARAALDAAGQISSLVNEAHDHRVVAPFAGYSAFLSSTVHIANLSSKNPAIEASSKQYLAWNVKYLSKMKKYWGMFHFVTEHLKDLYRRQADASLRARQGTSTPAESKGQEAIFQYGDWFDRYPNGVSGTDYEEAGNEIKRHAGMDAIFGQKPDLQSVEDFFAKMSPPARTAQSRKMAKRKQSKSSASNPVSGDGTNAANKTGQHGHGISSSSLDTRSSQLHMSSGFPNQSPGLPSSSDFSHDPAAANPFSAKVMATDMARMQAQQQQRRRRRHGYPSDTSGSGPMSHLDRHMVLSGYTGLDGHVVAPATPGNDNPLQVMDGLTFPAAGLDMQGGGGGGGAGGGGAGGGAYAFPSANTGGPHVQGNGQAAAAAAATQQDLIAAGGGVGGQWNEASSLSWFMPFNVDPPSILGDESGLFGNAFDFASLMDPGGFGTGDDDALAGLEGLDVDGQCTPGGQQDGTGEGV